MRKLPLPFVVLALFPVAAFSQRVPSGWNDPFPPHRIMDNVYYVGTKEIGFVPDRHAPGKPPDE